MIKNNSRKPAATYPIDTSRRFAEVILPHIEVYELSKSLYLFHLAKENAADAAQKAIADAEVFMAEWAKKAMNEGQDQ